MSAPGPRLSCLIKGTSDLHSHTAYAPHPNCDCITASLTSTPLSSISRAAELPRSCFDYFRRGWLSDGCAGRQCGCCAAPHALRAGVAELQSVSAPVIISATPVASTWSFESTSSLERQTAREQGWMIRANGARVRVPGVVT